VIKRWVSVTAIAVVAFVVSVLQFLWFLQWWWLFEYAVRWDNWNGAVIAAAIGLIPAVLDFFAIRFIVNSTRDSDVGD
jgi:hypothetical protein